MRMQQPEGSRAVDARGLEGGISERHISAHPMVHPSAPAGPSRPAILLLPPPPALPRTRVHPLCAGAAMASHVRVAHSPWRSSILHARIRLQPRSASGST